MPDNYNSRSIDGADQWTDSHAADWMDSRHPDSSTDGFDSSPTSADDILAIYKCFDFLERVWPTSSEFKPTAGPFTLEKEIGRGGMGRVWSAIQHEPVKRQVAIKLIKPGPQSRKMIRRFESERQTLALMNHPGIATLIDAGETDDAQLYFAMELVDGPDLIEYCDRNQLDLTSRLNLFLDACSAVQHAHQKGVIHRDLKPTNILVGTVDSEPRLKVIDFGLSKAESVPSETGSISDSNSPTLETNATLHGQVVGSLRYMSPEQAAGDLSNIDVRSDIYSLGVVLYKLLTDAVPLDARPKDATAEQVIESIQHDADSKPSQWLDKLDDSRRDEVASKRKISANNLQHVLQSDLDWIVMRSIEKSPEDRYSTVAEFAADIRRFIGGEPVLARPESKRYRIKKELSKNRVLWTSVAGIILALLSGFVISSYGLVSASAARNLAEKRLEQSRKSNEVLGNIFSDLDLNTIEATTDPFEVVVGRRLVKASAGLEGESIGDPLEVAKLQLKLAKALNSLEMYEEAVPIGRKAFDVLAELDTERELDNRAGMVLINSYLGVAKPAKGTEILTPLLNAALDEEGDSGETYLEFLKLKGNIALIQFNYKEAGQCFSHVARCREELYGRNDLRTLDARYWLADLVPGSRDEDSFGYDEIVEQYRLQLPEGHPKLIKVLSNHAWSLSDSGRPMEALPLAREAFKLAQDTYGDDNPGTHDARLILGLVLHHNGNIQDGVRLLEKAWIGLSETSGLHHPRAVTALMVLARMSRQDGDFRRAIELMEQANELSSGPRGTEIRLAHLFNDVGEYEKSRLLLEANIEKEKSSPRAKVLKMERLYEIGCSFELEGRYAEAIEAFQESLKLTPETMDKYNFPFMRMKLMLARTNSKLGNHEVAVEIINDYLDAMPESMGPKNRVRLCCEAEIGIAHRLAGKPDEAMAQLVPVFNSGVRLLNHSLLVREIRLAQTEAGKTDEVISGIEQELKFLYRTVPDGSWHLANRLRELGYDFLDYQLPGKAKELLLQSLKHYTDEKAKSWIHAQTRFDIARISLELEPPDSEAGQLAAIELEEIWNQMDEMREDAFPIEIKSLIESTKEVARIYGLESDEASKAIWLSRHDDLLK